MDTNKRQELAPGIEASPAVVSGAPVLEGTRIPVWVIVEALAEWESIEEVARAYEISPEQVKQALHYAAGELEEIRVGLLAR